VSAATALLERDAELERPSDAIETTLGGRGSTVAVEGPAGIGKSALLERAVEIARARGMRALVAQGGELEREFPYGVVRQFFEPALTAATPRSRTRLLAGAAHLAAPALSLGHQEAARRLTIWPDTGSRIDALPIQRPSRGLDSAPLLDGSGRR
jgi:hypothetical protein